MNLATFERSLGPSRQKKLARRRELVLRTGQELGLTAENAVIFGGAGFALHNLDTRVGHRLGHAFDVDSFVTREKFAELCLLHSLANFDPLGTHASSGHVVYVSRLNSPLPFTGFMSGNLSDDNDRNSYQDGYEAARTDCIEIEGMPTLPAEKLAAMKVKSGRARNLSGVVQAHIVGMAFENPIVQNPAWQEEVGTAIEKLQRGDVYKPHHLGNTIPEWLGALAQTNFDYPAFENVPH